MNKLYIICWTTKWGKGLAIGFLPFTQIPRNSILREAVFDNGHILKVHDYGIEGIYEDETLAEEHLRIERAWRDKDNLWIHTIDSDVDVHKSDILFTDTQEKDAQDGIKNMYDWRKK